MTIQEVVTVLDTFRDEYNTSKDPEVQKLCQYVSGVINNFNTYQSFFENSRTKIEQGQQYYTYALEVLNNILGPETNTVVIPDYVDVPLPPAPEGD